MENLSDSFHFFPPTPIFDNPLDNYRKDDIRRYLEANLEAKTAYFTYDDFRTAAKLLHDRGIVVLPINAIDPEIFEDPGDFKKYYYLSEEKVRVTCRHFPWGCSEVPEEHQAWSDGCPCVPPCHCHNDDGDDDDRYTYGEGLGSRSYIRIFPFQDEILGLHHIDNCYWDCCFISEARERWTIFPERPK